MQVRAERQQAARKRDDAEQDDENAGEADAVLPPVGARQRGDMRACARPGFWVVGRER